MDADKIPFQVEKSTFQLKTDGTFLASIHLTDTWPDLGALDINLSQLSPLSGVVVPARQDRMDGHGVLYWRTGTATPLSGLSRLRFV
jgi:hypothetical protein